MTRDFKQWWLADDDDVGTRRPHRPAAGKVTLTQNLPIQRRAGGGVRPAPKSIDLESFAFVQAYGGETKETSRASFPDDPPTSWLASGADQACRDAFDFDFTVVPRPFMRLLREDSRHRASSFRIWRGSRSRSASMTSRTFELTSAVLRPRQARPYERSSDSVGAIQHKTAGTHHKDRGAPSAVEIDEAFAFVLDALERGIQTRGLRSTR